MHLAVNRRWSSKPRRTAGLGRASRSQGSNGSCGAHGRKHKAGLKLTWSGGSVVVFFEESVTATVKDPLQGRTLLTVGLKYESVRQRTDRSER